MRSRWAAGLLQGRLSTAPQRNAARLCLSAVATVTTRASSRAAKGDAVELRLKRLDVMASSSTHGYSCF